jgi:hypothetical protein
MAVNLYFLCRMSPLFHGAFALSSRSLLGCWVHIKSSSNYTSNCKLAVEIWSSMLMVHIKSSSNFTSNSKLAVEIWSSMLMVHIKSSSNFTSHCKLVVEIWSSVLLVQIKSPIAIILPTANLH